MQSIMVHRHRVMKMKTFLLSALLLQAAIIWSTSAGEEYDPEEWDLADEDIAERFFRESDIYVSFTYSSPPSNNNENGNRPSPPTLEWRARTPLPSACGASVKVMGTPGDASGDQEYHWKHIFSDTMDPNVPSVDHLVMLPLDMDMLSQLAILDIDLESWSIGRDEYLNGLGLFGDPEEDDSFNYDDDIYDDDAADFAVEELEELNELEEESKLDDLTDEEAALVEELVDEWEEEEDIEEEKEEGGEDIKKRTRRRLDQEEFEIGIEDGEFEIGIEDGENLIFFRMFAFLPIGKGTLVSRTYAVSLPWKDSEYYGQGNPSSRRLEDVSGDAITTEVPLKLYELGDIESWTFQEYWGLSAIVSAPSYLRENYGASPLAFSIGVHNLRDESFAEVGSTLIRNTFIRFDLVGGNDYGPVAAAFHYGLDPFDGSDGEGLSVQTFYDYDGAVIAGVGEITIEEIGHGLARAQQVAEEPYGLIPLYTLRQGNLLSEPNTTIVFGAIFIDQYMNVRQSAEEETPLSELIVNIPGKPVMSPTGPPNYLDEKDEIAAAEICRPGTLRNLALATEGGSILEVSSNYGTSAADISSAWGAENAIDGSDNTSWASNGDGNDAFISVKLPFPTNVAYVDFHSRSMSDGTAQIYFYEVNLTRDDEITAKPAANMCSLRDATQPYRCFLSATNITVATFRSTRTSGGNTGAVAIGVWGCSVDESPDSQGGGPGVPTNLPSRCTSDNDCAATVRSRSPQNSAAGVALCQCYNASTADPFDECEGQGGTGCVIAKCMNTCAGLEARCKLSGEDNMCELQPIPGTPGASLTASNSGQPEIEMPNVKPGENTSANNEETTNTLPQLGRNSSSDEDEDQDPEEKALMGSSSGNIRTCSCSMLGLFYVTYFILNSF